MMEKIYAEMYCSALGPTEVKFYVESGASDEFIMQKITAADRAKLIFLLLYFLILTVERIISLVSVSSSISSPVSGSKQARISSLI